MCVLTELIQSTLVSIADCTRLLYLVICTVVSADSDHCPVSWFYLEWMHAEGTHDNTSVFHNPSVPLVPRVIPIIFRRNIAYNVVIQHLKCCTTTNSTATKLLLFSSSFPIINGLLSSNNQLLFACTFLMALLVGHRTFDSQVMGSSPGWALPPSAFGKLFITMCLCQKAV